MGKSTKKEKKISNEWFQALDDLLQMIPEEQRETTDCKKNTAKLMLLLERFTVDEEPNVGLNKYVCPDCGATVTSTHYPIFSDKNFCCKCGKKLTVERLRQLHIERVHKKK